MNVIEYPYWVWIFFFVIVLSALFVDIGIVNRKLHACGSGKETITWSLIWISLALAFNAFIYSQFGGFKAKEFLTGYLIELSLSIDNLFVFLLIFAYFKVPKMYQHRVLFWGIFMALVMRMVMIFAGAELVESFSWILYGFGAFLIYTGIKMFGEDEAFEPEDNAIGKLIHQIYTHIETLRRREVLRKYRWQASRHSAFACPGRHQHRRSRFCGGLHTRDLRHYDRPVYRIHVKHFCDPRTTYVLFSLGRYG